MYSIDIAKLDSVIHIIALVLGICVDLIFSTVYCTK